LTLANLLSIHFLITLINLSLLLSLSLYSGKTCVRNRINEQ
jgi:hypothetical protein